MRTKSFKLRCDGLWDKDTVEDKFNSAINENQIPNDMMAQLQYHTTVLGAQGPRYWFAFSANSEVVENEVLKKNLNLIMDLNYKEPVETA